MPGPLIRFEPRMRVIDVAPDGANAGIRVRLGSHTAIHGPRLALVVVAEADVEIVRGHAGNEHRNVAAT